MIAVVIEKPSTIKLKEIPIPEPGPNEILIRIEGCGVCGSNKEVWEGREWFNYPLAPGAPGHEGWGTVAAIGKNISDFTEGDRVAALTYNAFAEYDLAKSHMVVKLPGNLNGQPFPGEPLGCAVNIFRRSGIKEGDFVAVVGAGFIGALLISLAKNAGAKVIAISRRDFALETAKNSGADHTIKMEDHWAIVDKVKEITNGNLCDCVIEATGKQWPLDLAGDLTKTRGSLIIAGYHQDGLRNVNMQMWNWKGIDVINAHERDDNIYIRGIKEAVELISENKINPGTLYTHCFNLDQIEKGLNMLETRPDGFIKSIIVINS